MALDSSPFLVQAIYSFKGKNNDELCFKKGDIITITQREEGGWWEGTLGEKTGWFPSNYVKEYKTQSTDCSGKTSPSKLPPELVAQQKVYRNLVLKDLIDSEKAHVAELQGLLKNFLHPLEKSDILTREEYRQLVGNIGNVVETHQQLLSTLEECNQRPPLEQRVGKVFLGSAPRIKQVHQAYCSSHPKAVCILDKYKEELNEFMEAQGAASPGLLVLTTGLSKPFRRLEKYAGMLQELERHIEENHPDRGDTQRSISVYKDIASASSATRRQKELELEVLTGGVRGWEGEDLSCLGDILHMGSVAVGPDHRDRYLVLFPSTLLMLSVSQRMSAFIYEGKLPLMGINVTKLEDTEAYKNAFEITGPLIERIMAVCQTKEDQQTWVDQLKQQIRTVRKSSVSSPTRTTSPPPAKPQPLPPPHVSLPPASPYSQLTAFFAELVQRGVITRQVLKRLLYPQFKDDGVGVNILGVKVRHNHKVECVIFPTRVSMGTYTVKQTWLKSSSTDTNSSESSEYSLPEQKLGFLERQDAVDCDSDEDGSCSSNPFGFIRYYDPKSPGSVKSIEGFVDGRYAGLVEVCGESTIKHSEVPGRCISHQAAAEDKTLPASGKPKSGAAPKLLVADSSESSFERTSAHRSFPCAVCEDLSQIDGTQLEPETVSESKCTRQSLPVTGIDAFSSPIPSALSVPSNQFKSEKDLYTSCHGVSVNPKPLLSHSMPVLPQEPYSPPTTHSSTLDMPTNFIPVPGAVMAELLYNLEPLEEIEPSPLPHQPDSLSSDHSVESVQTVRDLPGSPLLSDSCHSVYSDSRKFRRRIPSGGSNCQAAPRRCFSYHFINIGKNDDGEATKCRNAEHCRCCAEVPCSSRSSDSGLADIAGSSAYISPELQDHYGVSKVTCCVKPSDGSANCIGASTASPSALVLTTPRESNELDESGFEAQCICTSPFGSTPRTSAQTSLTSEKVFVGLTDPMTPSVTCSSLAPSPLLASQPWHSSGKVHEVTPHGGEVYRSGLYAHWWLKTKIPASAVRSKKLETDVPTDNTCECATTKQCEANPSAS